MLFPIMGCVCFELWIIPVIFPLCTHCPALFGTKLPLFDPVDLLSWIYSGKAPRKGSGTQGTCLVQTMVTREDGSALLLLLLSGCSRCGSALLPHHSLLRCFRGFIPAWLVRASEDRLHLAGGHSPAPPSHAPGRAAAQTGLWG